MSEKKNGKELKEMGFLDHLEELRWRIIKSLLSVLFFAVIAFLFSDVFIKLLVKPIKEINPAVKFQVLKVQGILVLKLWIAFAMGIAFSIPVIVYQIWAFVSPGLYEHEKRWIPWLFVGVTCFFIAGAVFAYFVIIPFAVRFLTGLGIEDVEKNISINYYAKFVMQLILASGILFQMPVLSFILTKIGLISPMTLKKYWRHAVVVILVLAAFITPPDPVSMIMMGIPLFFLYEFSILVSKIAYKPVEEDTESPAG